MNRRPAFAVIASAGLLALGIAAVLVFALCAPLQGMLRGKPQAASFDWLSRTMRECEENAVTRPETLNFLVVPLMQSKNFGPQWQQRALSTVGKMTLFGSQDALAALNADAVRISSRHYVLHTLDTSDNSTRRWNSASGVARLSTTEVASDGPFRVRFQISADDAQKEWSSITAEGRGTCHWAFVVLRE